jgi:hypothetical protein
MSGTMQYNFRLEGIDHTDESRNAWEDANWWGSFRDGFETGFTAPIKFFTRVTGEGVKSFTDCVGPANTILLVGGGIAIIVIFGVIIGKAYRVI